MNQRRMPMKNINSADVTKAQHLVCDAMGEITRATTKVLAEYFRDGYIKGFAKAIAYLDVDPAEADDILQSFAPDVRKKIIECSKSYNKNDATVVSEVEHIITVEGMSFENEYRIIKENLLMTGQSFAAEAIKKFRTQTPIFQEQLNHCIFDFEDINLLDTRSIQKILRDTDQQELAKALKGAPTELQDKIFGCMSKRAADMLKEDMEFMGPVRLSEVEASRAKIVQTVFRLEEEGDIAIARVTVGELVE